jgi:hypothetical protein
MATKTATHFTIGEAAVILQCHPGRVRRLFTSGKLPEPERFGSGGRSLSRRDLERARKLLAGKGSVACKRSKAPC